MDTLQIAVRRTRHAMAVGLALTFLAPEAKAQWDPAYQQYAVQRIGLVDAAHTSDMGMQFSAIQQAGPSGIVTGYSSRYSPISGTDAGHDAWVWNGAVTQQIGLTGAAYSSSFGLRYSFPTHLNASGQVAGFSYRFPGGSWSSTQDAWVWNGSSTQQIGLVGGIYSNSGRQYSHPLAQNTAGQVVGLSERYDSQTASLGKDAWIWRGSSTQLIGLVDGVYVGDSGYRYNIPKLQNAAGQVVGSSQRVSRTATIIGTDTWVWNGTSTQQIGLTGGMYTGSQGYQQSSAEWQNDAGQVVGNSRRYAGVNTDRGQDTWVWNGSDLVQIGLAGGIYAGSAGLQFSVPKLQNQSGQVAGYSNRYTGVSRDNGQDAWVWTASGTHQVGLLEVDHIAPSGYRFTQLRFQNDAGQVVGHSNRYISGNVNNGANAWVWDGQSTRQIGLVNDVHTGSAGFQITTARLQNQAGEVAGTSSRYTGINTYNGVDAWVCSGGETTQVGSTGGLYTGSEKYQFSTVALQDASGRVAGYSHRVAGVNTQIGQDAWYYDPATNLTSAIVGSVRASDNYAFSDVTLLTDAGFLLGYYSFFANGEGAAEDRAFIYRPDLGLTDLGALVSGGLGEAGWDTLRRPKFSMAMDFIVGHGLVSGQASSGQSVFIMNIPTPGVVSLLLIAGTLSVRRRRSVRT